MTVTFDLQSGRNLAEEKPEDKPEIDERLEKLNFKWQELEAASKLKGQKLGDAKKQEEFNSGVKSIEGWITELETMNVSTEKATDLTTATRLYQKHKVGAVQVTPAARFFSRRGGRAWGGVVGGYGDFPLNRV